jgi:hypothetical protein
MKGGGIMAIQGEVNKQSEVRNEVERMKRLSEEAWQATSELEQRIAIILRPVAPAAAENLKNKVSNVPFSVELLEINEKLGALIIYIRDIKNRCEL